MTQGSKRASKSAKAGIIFPVGRIKRKLKEGRYAHRIGDRATVALAAGLQYVLSDLMQLSIDQAYKFRRSRIAPRHILLSVRLDKEFSLLLQDDTSLQSVTK